MAFNTAQGNIHGPLLNFSVATKRGTQSFGASTSLTAISGLSVNITPQHVNNYLLILAQLTIGGNSATSMIATLMLNGGEITDFRGNADGSRIRCTSRTSQDGQYEAHTIPLMGMWSPGSTSAQTISVSASANAGTFWVNRSHTSNNDTSRDSSRPFSCIQVFEFHS